ncbi:MAG: phosphodiester glycosidase family protein [Cyanobacteriota bacterium]|nr:phosphodiester glycosidase family protein [Cyanobacteriota bacterium]
MGEKRFWLGLLTALLATWPIPLSAGPGPRLLQPPPPPSADLPPSPGNDPAPSQVPRMEGLVLSINGQRQRGAWRWAGPTDAGPLQLWLPLEVLQGQLGFSSRGRVDGALELEWFGRRQVVPSALQISLADEVAIDVAPFLSPDGLTARVDGGELRLRMPLPEVRQVRSSAPAEGGRRLVLDLTGPAVVRSGEGPLWLAAQVSPAVMDDLRRLGFTGQREGDGWLLKASAAPLRVFTLGDPARVVLDLTAASAPPSAAGPAPAGAMDPRLRALLGSEVRWSQDTLVHGGRRLRLNSVRIDPVSSSLELRPLSRGASMEGLSTLPLLARRHDALVAINGGYFNRVRRLPLGALRDQGRWLSGPILNRGVVAWEPSALPRFGRLDLRESVSDGSGRDWPVFVVNSGYVRSGLARYTGEWGSQYRSLSGSEQAVVLRDGVVQRRYDSGALAAGVPLGPTDQLLVARGGAPLPWGEGTRLQLSSQANNPLGSASNVVGGGPLLLQDGRVVLDGQAEGFSSAFLRQGAPRTVIASDGRYLWLLTLQGVDDEGPTLAETAQVLLAAGLRDALNLDGGSSTGLVMGGLHTVKGRGVVSAVHNGLGLVPRAMAPAEGAAPSTAPAQGMAPSLPTAGS